VARRDASVQHHRLSPVVRVDRPARLFLCAGCRVRVILCSRCDRGNRHCWRNAARREAARRYQCSRHGRIAHVARSRRWRQRHSLGGDNDNSNGSTAAADNVTHEGCHARVLAAPLVTCTHDTAHSTALDPIAVAPAAPGIASTAVLYSRTGFVRGSCAAAQGR